MKWIILLKDYILFLMKKGAFLRHNEQILSFIDLSFSFFAEIFQ